MKYISFQEEQTRRIYVNSIWKSGKCQWKVIAIGNTTIKNRDGKPQKSRTFKNESALSRFLKANEYQICYREKNSD